MPKQTTPTPIERKKIGRPKSGVTRTKISITVPTGLLEIATKAAFKRGESISQYISRAIQDSTLQA